MLDRIPDERDLTALVSEKLAGLWKDICGAVESRYDMVHIWDKGGKAWTYELKYRTNNTTSGKTLCSLYAREGCIGFMIIFGKKEREKFEVSRADYSAKVQEIYDASRTYHDGKWIMLEPDDTSMLDDLIKLLAIKRRPKKVN